MNLGQKLKIIALAFVCCASVVPAAQAEEIGGTGDLRVFVNGQFSHSKVQSAVITGVPAGSRGAFRQEIFGPSFNLSVPNLYSGKYTIIIGLVENAFDQPGARVFDINHGREFLAQNLDIFSVAGAKGKAFYLTNTLDFTSDNGPGTLVLTFTAHQNEAKLNTFELRDATTGESRVVMRASELTSDYLDDNPAARKQPVVEGPELWRDATEPLETRIKDLISRMSLAEKISELNCDAPAIPRLGVPAYSYRNEALHGLQAHSGFATVFPQAIGMAAAWDTPLIHEEADVIATEARATHNNYVATHHGDSTIHFGLNLYAPNINIFRDPRWGRGQETYGEDPFLTGQTAVAFVTGLQGNDPRYFKTIATLKHFAVHSGPEPERHRFDSEPSERDLCETYLPAFEMGFREGHAYSVMGAYSDLFGIPACASHFLLTDILRTRWGFKGFVVSDGGAIHDIDHDHKYVSTPAEAAAAAVKAGDDMCSGGLEEYYALALAAKKGWVRTADIDTALTRSLEARFRLGIFDPPAQVPFAQIPISENDTPAHEALALKVARESIVLLKNNGLLPLDRSKLKRIALVGANADSVPVLLGNYEGQPSHPVTLLAGLRAVAGSNIEVICDTNVPLAVKKGGTEPTAESWSNTLAAVAAADVIIYAGGLNAKLEGEQMKVDYEGFEGGDRTRIELPTMQTKFLQALQATGKPVVFVNCSGSAIAMPWEAANLPAIVQAWYPGEQGGRAVAEVLFGEVNPAGRLPVTFYGSTTDLPPFEEYSMSNRTYRYFSGTPEFGFGHGLSYTKFDYQAATLNQSRFATNDTVKVSFSVTNTGDREGDEVPQIYFRHVHSAVDQPRLALCGFSRLHLPPGQSSVVTVEIPTQRFRYWDVTQKGYVVETGDYELMIGAASDDIRQRVPFTIGSTQ